MKITLRLSITFTPGAGDKAEPPIVESGPDALVERNDTDDRPEFGVGFTLPPPSN